MKTPSQPEYDSPLGTPEHRRLVEPVEQTQDAGKPNLVLFAETEIPLGVPILVPVDVRAVASDAVFLPEHPSDSNGREYKKLPFALPLPEWLLNHGLKIATFVILVFGGLIVFSYTLTTLTQISALPMRVQPIALGVLAALFIEIGIGAWRCLLSVMRLRRAQSINLHSLAAWKERAEARERAAHDAKAAVRELCMFLETFPLDKMEQRGFAADEIKALRIHRSRLLEGASEHAANEWLKRYRDDFQATLLMIGQRLAERRARSIAWRVAASPLPLLDTLVVLNGARQLIMNLCDLHRLRPDTRGLFLVTLWAVTQAALAGKLESSMDTDLEARADQWVNGDMDQVPNEEIVEGLGKSIGEHALKGIGQGVAQYLLLRKLGRTIQMYLRLVD